MVVNNLYMLQETTKHYVDNLGSVVGGGVQAQYSVFPWQELIE